MMDEAAERELMEVERMAIESASQKVRNKASSGTMDQPTPIVQPVASGSQLAPPPLPVAPAASVDDVEMVIPAPTKAALTQRATWEEKELLRARVEAADESFLDGLDYEPIEKPPAKKKKIVLDIADSDEEVVPVARARSTRIARGLKRSEVDDYIVLG